MRYRIAMISVALIAATWVGVSRASDHQDTPEVELHPRLDINDVYAFPGATADRIVLAVTTSSPLTPAQTPTAFFENKQLYQIKVDNNGDAIEDLVLQFRFIGDGPGQTVQLLGPVAPELIGTRTRFVDSTPTLTGPVNTVIGSSSGVQLFAGRRDDPFFIDLDQFFRIIPDRRPVQGPLSKIGPKPEATAFRSPAFDFLRGLNALAIVVELPVNMLLGSSASATDPALGIWATTSR